MGGKWDWITSGHEHVIMAFICTAIMSYVDAVIGLEAPLVRYVATIIVGWNNFSMFSEAEKIGIRALGNPCDSRVKQVALIP